MGHLILVGLQYRGTYITNILTGNKNDTISNTDLDSTSQKASMKWRYRGAGMLHTITARWMYSLHPPGNAQQLYIPRRMQAVGLLYRLSLTATSGVRRLSVCKRFIRWALICALRQTNQLLECEYPEFNSMLANDHHVAVSKATWLKRNDYIVIRYMTIMRWSRLTEQVLNFKSRRWIIFQRRC